MQQHLFVLALAACLPAIATAQNNRSYPCTNGALMRSVEVVYTGAGAVPCEVRYHKASEAPGAPQVLWRASVEAGYCEARARDFVAKLQGLGWTCSDAGSSAAPAARAPGRSDATAVFAAAANPTR